MATILLIPAIPLIALLLCLIRLTSAGPGIYRQKRVGKHGHTFVMYKLRTMRCDAEASTGAVWSTSDDPRATRLGLLLRRLHLDELPQLFNVIKGEMSLVGPRPERPEFVHVLVKRIPGYRDRVAVPPGVTGLAQLNLPPDSDLASVCQKLVLDTEYIQGASLSLDARIILCTALRMVKLPVIRFLGLQRHVPVVRVDGNGPAGGNEATGAKESSGTMSPQTATNQATLDTVTFANDKSKASPAHKAGKQHKPR
jgi:lipopolysaccharide/colanic/teichoic acid biosynthesis glycosyltransferase